MELESLDMQALYLDDSDRRKITSATVSIAGLGGVGGYVLEGMVRNGIRHLRVSDPDTFQPSNLRQSLMTRSTLGKNKAEVACTRALDIAPDTQLVIFEGGIRPSNCRKFVKNCDVVMHEADTVGALLMIHFWARIERVPVVQGCRTSWLQSGELGAKVTDYRRGDLPFVFTRSHMLESWGIPETLFASMMEHIHSGVDDDSLFRSVELANRTYRLERTRALAFQGESGEIEQFTMGKSRSHLKQIMKDYPDDFDKRRIAPEQAIIMGGLAVRAAKELILEPERSEPEQAVHRRL